MTEYQKDLQNTPQSLADAPTRQKLAKARMRTRSTLARRLKVSKETIRRYEKRGDLYLTTLRHYAKRRGGAIRLELTFPDQPPVLLSGLGGDEVKKKAKKKAGSGVKS